MKNVLLVFSFVFLPLMSFSQEGKKLEFSGDEIKEFVLANKAIMKVQQEGEQLMVKAIEKNNMDIESFNKMYQASQDPEQEVEAGEKEQKQFEAIMMELVQIQQGLQLQMSEAITETGMELEKFEKMMMAYQQDPNLQQKVNELMTAE